METLKTNRRGFMKSATAAAGALAFSNIMPGKVLGANERITYGIIGTGGMGTGHIDTLNKIKETANIDIQAVCDVYQRRLTNAQTVSGAPGTMDYRRVLDNKDIDAVLIATPDHWHSKISIEALEAGKHVYCEKPMTLTTEQAIEVRNVVRRTGLKFQVGPMKTSEEQYWLANKAINDGRVGKVTWAQGSYNRNIKGCGFNTWFKIDETAGPQMTGEDYVDWNMWLGHEWGLAPRIPWNPEHYFRFRKYFQYNGGVATDLLYHVLAPLLLAITGPNGEYPGRVSGNGGLYIYKDGRDIPDVFMMSIEYPKSEFTVNLTSVLTNNTQRPTRVYGQLATIDFERDARLTGNGDYRPDFQEMNNGQNEVTLPSSGTRGGDYSDMHLSFQDAIRNGGEPCCNVDLATATMIAIKLGVESYRQGKMMHWDTDKEMVKA